MTSLEEVKKLYEYPRERPKDTIDIIFYGVRDIIKNIKSFKERNRKINSIVVGNDDLMESVRMILLVEQEILKIELDE